MIHVMAVARLGGATVAAAIMGYDAITVIEEEQHLRVPVISRQRPSMTEHDGLTFAPVLVIDLRAVFSRDASHGVPRFKLMLELGARRAYLRGRDDWS